MRRAIYHGIRDVRVEDIDELRPEPNEVVVRVVYCGICGSDLHEYLHGPFPISPFGHEVCGEVVEIGSDAGDIRVGDRVVAFARDGYAERMLVRYDRVLRLPDSVPWKRAAVLEPLAGAAYAVGRSGMGPADTVLVAGAGPVGLMVLLAARAVGAQTVYVTELSERRRDLAMELGATEVFDPAAVKVPQQMRERTAGRGVDIAVEAVGVEATLKDCLASTRHRGTVLVQGIFTERVPIHMLGFVSREITMIGTNSIDAERALEWIVSGKLEPEKIVTSIVPLDDIGDRGFDVLADDKDRDVKILIEP
jgi:(R,R)-butanediol dehydrogenase/meso-butanediol dehydrogenase/diacetyl reductase